MSPRLPRVTASEVIKALKKLALFLQGRVEVTKFIKTEKEKE